MWLIQFSQSWHILHGARFHADQRIGLQLERQNVARQVVLRDPLDLVAGQVQLLQMNQLVQANRHGGQQVLAQVSDERQRCYYRQVRTDSHHLQCLQFGQIANRVRCHLRYAIPLEQSAMKSIHFRHSLHV